jgi:hypothetical protein
VGALFTTSSGQLGKHFCTASVVDSPAGDLLMTAAHCVTGTSGTIDSSASQDDDFAFLRVSDPSSTIPIEDETGAEKLEFDCDGYTNGTSGG